MNGLRYDNDLNNLYAEGRFKFGMLPTFKKEASWFSASPDHLPYYANSATHASQCEQRCSEIVTEFRKILSASQIYVSKGFLWVTSTNTQ